MNKRLEVCQKTTEKTRVALMETDEVKLVKDSKENAELLINPFQSG